MATDCQTGLFDDTATVDDRSGSFTDNMRLPIHRWFRYSAGFSAAWADAEIRKAQMTTREVRVLDPFAGSGTTLICAQQAAVPSFGVEAHPFVIRVARAKINCGAADAEDFLRRIREAIQQAETNRRLVVTLPDLLTKCFSPSVLSFLMAIRTAVRKQEDGSVESELVWLALVSILRSVSHVGTAPWQYILPNKSKSRSLDPAAALSAMAQMMVMDMTHVRRDAERSVLLASDARTCEGVPDGFATLVLTSPPYANNYDYADATRLEMTFLGDIGGWSDLQESVRQYLIRSCSQHVTERNTDLNSVLNSPALAPISGELRPICETLGEVRLLKGGKKNYHLMAACYFADMASVWIALRRVTTPDAKVCFVLGDSAPYGVYLPVVEWMGALAEAAGFSGWSFEKLRDRNLKWKNRKHRVPLMEGRLWVNS